MPVMTPPSSKISSPRALWMLEYTEPIQLGMKAEGGMVTSLMDYCLTVAGDAALDPEHAVIVFSGEVAESVRDRLPAGSYRDKFDLARGDGMMGAKAMRVDDEVHIVFPAFLLWDSGWLRSVDPIDEQGFIANAAARKQYAKRLAIHESGHVATFQAREESEEFSGEPLARRKLLHTAQQIIDEYRAELDVPQSLMEEWDAQLSVESVTALRTYVKAAAAEVPRNRNHDQLGQTIVDQAQNLWKVLACLAAVRRTTGVPLGEPFPDEVTATIEWTEMLSAHWHEFEGFLSETPSSRTRMTTRSLKARAEGLADLLDGWLVTFGFVWRDAGGSTQLSLR